MLLEALIQKVEGGLASAPRVKLLKVAGGLAAVVAVVDWLAGAEVTLGAFYVFPILLLSLAAGRGTILGAALLFTGLRLAFTPPNSLTDGMLRGLFALLSYSLIGLFTHELVRRRREIESHLKEIRRQETLRREAEEQLRLLVESSPAAVLTLGGDGRVLSANRAAEMLLGFGAGIPLVGERIAPYLPVLDNALQLDTGKETFRTAAQTRGLRRNGTPFQAHTWFSTYPHRSGGKRLAAIAVDVSEEMRDREERNFAQLAESSRIVAAAVAHEMKNLCGAVSVVYANLQARGAFAGDRDFEALGHLVAGLESMAQRELQAPPDGRSPAVELAEVLGQLRILIEPSWEDSGGKIHWPDVSAPLQVKIDGYALLQALLNLTQNSLRAVQGRPDAELRLAWQRAEDRAVLAVSDNGPGVADPESLFRPFMPTAAGNGMGLYIARALLRRYGAELRFRAVARGACFEITLPVENRRLTYDIHPRSGDSIIAGR